MSFTTVLNNRPRMPPKTLKEIVTEVGFPVFIEWSGGVLPGGRILLGAEPGYEGYVGDDGVHYVDTAFANYYEALGREPGIVPYVVPKLELLSECKCPDLLNGHHVGCGLWKP